MSILLILSILFGFVQQPMIIHSGGYIDSNGVAHAEQTVEQQAVNMAVDSAQSYAERNGGFATQDGCAYTLVEGGVQETCFVIGGFINGQGEVVIIGGMHVSKIIVSNVDLVKFDN